MSARSQIVGCAVAGLMTACAAASAENIILNPGFETGDLTHWPHAAIGGSISVTQASSHSGAYSVRFTSVNASTMTILQGVSPTPTEYLSDVSFWYRYGGNPNAAPATFRILYTDLTMDSFQTTGTPSSWTRLDVTSLLAAGKSIQQIEVLAGGQGQHVYVDDVTMSVVPAPGAAALLGFAATGMRRRRR